MEKEPAVYILTNRPNGTLYVGVTSDLAGRLDAHVRELFPGFTKRYGLKCLVYYEVFDCMDDAIIREKRLKNWKRAWKIRLILQANPEWCDLYNHTDGQVLDLPGDEQLEFERTNIQWPD